MQGREAGSRVGKYVCEESQLMRESRCAEDDVMLRGDEGYLGCNDALVPMLGQASLVQFCDMTLLEGAVPRATCRSHAV